MTSLETERLVLRSPQPSDAREIAAALNDFEISKNLALVPFPYTLEDANAYVARAAEDLMAGRTYRFLVRRKRDGILVGGSGLHLKNGCLDLGYWIARPHWRQGYASETAERLVEYAFDELEASEIMAGWYHDNGISGRVLAKLGFSAVRVEKQYCAARGHEVLANRCMLTREEFGRRKAA